jgi:hypothetical protein
MKEFNFTHEGKLGFEAFNELVKFLDDNVTFKYYIKRDYTKNIITYKFYKKENNEYLLDIELNKTIQIEKEKISIKI